MKFNGPVILAGFMLDPGAHGGGVPLQSAPAEVLRRGSNPAQRRYSQLFLLITKALKMIWAGLPFRPALRFAAFGLNSPSSSFYSEFNTFRRRNVACPWALRWLPCMRGGTVPSARSDTGGRGAQVVGDLRTGVV